MRLSVWSQFGCEFKSVVWNLHDSMRCFFKTMRNKNSEIATCYWEWYDREIQYFWSQRWRQKNVFESIWKLILTSKKWKCWSLWFLFARVATRIIRKDKLKIIRTWNCLFYWSHFDLKMSTPFSSVFSNDEYLKTR